MQKELKRWLQYKDRYIDSEYLFCTKRCTILPIRCFERNLKNYGNRIGLK